MFLRIVQIYYWMQARLGRLVLPDDVWYGPESVYYLAARRDTRGIENPAVGSPRLFALDMLRRIRGEPTNAEMQKQVLSEDPGRLARQALIRGVISAARNAAVPSVEAGIRQFVRSTTSAKQENQHKMRS